MPTLSGPAGEPSKRSEPRASQDVRYTSGLCDPRDHDRALHERATAPRCRRPDGAARAHDHRRADARGVACRILRSGRDHDRGPLRRGGRDAADWAGGALRSVPGAVRRNRPPPGDGGCDGGHRTVVRVHEHDGHRRAHAAGRNVARPQCAPQPVPDADATRDCRAPGRPPHPDRDAAQHHRGKSARIGRVRAVRLLRLHTRRPRTPRPRHRAHRPPRRPGTPRARTRRPPGRNGRSHAPAGLDAGRGLPGRSACPPAGLGRVAAHRDVAGRGGAAQQVRRERRGNSPGTPSHRPDGASWRDRRATDPRRR